MKLNPRAPLRSAWLFAGALICFGGCGHTTKVQDTPAEDRKQEQKDDDKRPGGERRRAKPAASPSAESSKGDRDQVPVAPSPTQSLAEGSVKELQQKLQEKGLLASGQGNVTGKWDSKTETALRKFQADNGLPATGYPDRASAKALGLDPDELFKRGQDHNEGEKQEGEDKQAAQEDKQEARQEKQEKREGKQEAREDKREAKQAAKQNGRDAKGEKKAGKARKSPD